MNTIRRAMAGVAATALMVGAGVLSAPGASASTTCRTIEGAKMCVNVIWPVDSNKYYGKGWIQDVAGGPNLSVAVSNIRLQNYNGSRWVTVRTLSDFDGWAGTSDTGTTSSVNPCNYRNPVFRTVASFTWKGGQSGSKTLATISHGHTC